MISEKLAGGLSQKKAITAGIMGGAAFVLLLILIIVILRRLKKIQTASESMTNGNGFCSHVYCIRFYP